MPSVVETSLVVNTGAATANVAKLRGELRETQAQAVKTSASVDEIGSRGTGRKLDQHAAAAGRVSTAHTGIADAAAAGGVATKQAAADATKAAGQQERAAAQVAAAHQRAARSVTKSWTDSGSAMVTMGKVTVATLAASAAAAVDLGVKWQAATRDFTTQAGVSQKAAKQLGDGILKMAGSVGQTPQALAGGLYHVVSSMNALLPATNRVNVELGIERDAAKLAAVGHSNLTDTSYVLSSAMNALGQKGVKGATATMKELNAIVGTGDMHLQDLMGAMSTGLVSAAATFGVSLHSVGAALAYMTDRGVPAQQAATRLRMSIALLGAPTKQSAGIIADLGLSAGDVRTRTKAMSEALASSGVTTSKLAADMAKPDGIFVALRDLKTHMTDAGISAHNQADIIARAFGGGRSGGTIMAMYNNLDVIRTKYNQQTKVANQFDSAWALTQKNLGFQLKQGKGAIESIGTTIGTDMIPWVEKAIGLGKDLAHWFAENKLAGEALAVVIGTTMVAAVTALGVNIAKRIGGGLKDFYKFGKALASAPGNAGWWVASKVGLSSPAVASSTSPNAVRATGGDGGLVGWRGSALELGSTANPMAVLVVDPSGSPLTGAGGVRTAGLPASGTSAVERASTGMVTTESGLIVPSSSIAAGSAPKEVEKAAGGIGSRIKGVGSSVAGNFGLIGVGLGVGASQVAGHAIGGRTGGVVSSVGTGASIGAGVGSLAGPEGLLVGAVGGAIVGGLAALFHSKSFGDKVTDSFTKGFGGSHRSTLQSQVSRALNTMHSAESTTHMVAAGRAGGIPETVHLNFASLSAAQQAKVLAAAHTAGTLTAKQLEAGWNQYKFQSEPDMFIQLRSEIKKFPPQAQAAAVASAVKFAEGLEKQGRLTKGSAGFLLKQVEGEFPGFERYLGLAGESSIKAFNKALDFSQSEQQMKVELNKVSGDFEPVQHAVSNTAGTVQKKTKVAINALKTLASGTGKSAAAARADIKGLEKATDSSFDAMAAKVATQTTRFRKSVSSNSQQALQIGSKNFEALAASIASYIGSGAEATGKGLANITAQVNAALKSFGEKSLSAVSVKALSAAQLAGVVSGQVSSGAVADTGGANAGHAKGGRLPGPATGDHIPLYSRGGGLLGVADGGELIVNGPSEARVDSMLGMFGTRLSSIVSNETRPHTQGAHQYATGGRLAGGGTHWDRLLAAANVVSSRNFPYVYGGGHENPAELQPFDCSGAVSYVTQQAGYKVPTTVSGDMGSWGFPRGPGSATIFYNPVHTFMRIGDRYFGTSGFARPGGGAGWFDQSPGASYLSEFSEIHLPNLGSDAGSWAGGISSIKQPKWTGPGGVIGAIGTGALRKATRAANAKLARSQPAGAAGSGQGLELGLPAGGATVGASEFGGPGDPGTGSTGYRGDNLNSHPNSYAELDMGTALGGLPYMTPLRVSGPRGSEVLYKRDIGLGGGPVDGHPREIDLWYKAAQDLGVNGLGLVKVERMGNALGGRLGDGPSWGGWHAKGTDMTVRAPTVFGAGERGAERVQITPLGQMGI